MLPSRHRQQATSADADLESTLNRLLSSFPLQAFTNPSLPPLLYKHQLYAVPCLGSRTRVDQELETLCQRGKIRLFQLGSTLSDECIVLSRTDDFVECIRRQHSDPLTEKFLLVLRQTADLVWDRVEHLTHFTDSDLRSLAEKGLLALHRIVGKWLPSIPGAGSFVKAHMLGRRALLRALRSSRYREMLQSELEKRRLPLRSKMSMEHFILDLVGSGAVVRVASPTGPVIRLE